jgi:uncharacterized protein
VLNSIGIFACKPLSLEHFLRVLPQIHSITVVGRILEGGLEDFEKIDAEKGQWILQQMQKMRESPDEIPLVIVARAGFLEAIKILIHIGANVNEKDPKYSRSALWVTCLNAAAVPANAPQIVQNSIERANEEREMRLKDTRIMIVKALVEAGANVNDVDSSGTPFFALACSNGFTDVAVYLLSKGADIEAKTAKGLTALHLAAHGNQWDTCKVLLDAGAKVFSVGYASPLLLAAMAGRLDLIKIMLEPGRGTDVNEGSALAAATALSRFEAARYLLDAGADVNLPIPGGSPALRYAVRHGILDLVLALIAAGANVNYQDPGNDGWSIAMSAVSKQREEICRVLIASGANVNLHSTTGDTALRVAIRFDEDADHSTQKKIVSMLIDAGADMNHRSPGGLTVLHEAIRYPHMLSMLIAAGAPLDAPDEDGMTPLHTAVTEESLEAVQALLNAKANVLVKDSEGDTALHVAVLKAQDEIVKVLIAAGADVNAQNGDGQTPLYLAVLKNDEQDLVGIVKQLLAAGADPNLPSGDNTTPLALATVDGYDEIVQALIQAGAVAMSAQDGDDQQ